MYIPTVPANMTVAEYLGWARSLLDSLGLTNYIVAFVVVSVAFALVRQIRGGGD